MLSILLAVNVFIESVAATAMFSTANSTLFPAGGIVALLSFFFACVLYVLFIFFMYHQ